MVASSYLNDNEMYGPIPTQLGNHNYSNLILGGTGNLFDCPIPNYAAYSTTNDYSVNCNACAASPCMNGGNCTSVLPTSYTCACPPQYSGVNCTSKSFFHHLAQKTKNNKQHQHALLL